MPSASALQLLFVTPGWGGSMYLSSSVDDCLRGQLHIAGLITDCRCSPLTWVIARPEAETPGSSLCCKNSAVEAPMLLHWRHLLVTALPLNGHTRT